MKEVVVRTARRGEIGKLVKLEEEIFKSEGIRTFDKSHFEAWFEINPEEIYVAEQGGFLVGYGYAQFINCDPESPDEIKKWTSFDAITDNGYTETTHCPNGNYRLGVSVGSLLPGAGRALVAKGFELAKTDGRPLLFMSRISGLQAYFDGLPKNSSSAGDLNEIALSYILACARMERASVNLLPGASQKTTDCLPELANPDPVLNKYLKNPRVQIWALLPNFLTDEASLNYNVLLGPAR